MCKQGNPTCKCDNCTCDPCECTEENCCDCCEVEIVTKCGSIVTL